MTAATYTKRLDDGRYEFGDVVKFPERPEILVCRGIAATYADAQFELLPQNSSFFLAHRCSRCKDGERTCVRGGHDRCEWPHAKNA